MTKVRFPKINLRLPVQGLMMQLITIILLPLTIILLVITFGSLTIHQNAMRELVGDRDERAVITAAHSLSAQIDLRKKEISGIAMILSTSELQPGPSDSNNENLFLDDFDRGIAVLDGKGNLLSTHGNSQFWLALTKDSETWQAIVPTILARPGEINVNSSPGAGSYTGIISSLSRDGRMIAGAFSITNMVESTLVNILPTGNELSILLVDAKGDTLFRSGFSTDTSIDHPGVTDALQGKSGTVYVKIDGDEHVTAYSPVSAGGWALITEESWEAVSTPTLRTTQLAPLLLVPALVIMLLALWLGTRQIIQPLRVLEAKSEKLASGDFSAIQEPVGGIAEIQRLQKELIEMAHKVEDAQRSLHGYIGSITTAQEEERRRIARELHDDTLQALIALKQRVQLAQLELQVATGQTPPESNELEEIASLTEQTIENLRRLTRALRPIYLEDLGLVPALEMLAREIGQGAGTTVEFRQQGTERRLDANVELALYRIAQEALSNIARHARATQASITINFSPGTIVLQVIDNGAGFSVPGNLAENVAEGHYGLVGLYERAELIHANLNIQTSHGKGTTVTVTLHP